MNENIEPTAVNPHVRDLKWRSIASTFPLLFMPVIIFFVDDSFTRSVYLSLMMGASALIFMLFDYVHFKLTGEWDAPSLSIPFVAAGGIAMLAEAILFMSGVQISWLFMGLQFTILVMFVHSAWCEWKRWYSYLQWPRRKRSL